MNELERALVALGRELEYPATPELASPVLERLREAPARVRPAPRLGARRIAIVALAIFLLACGTVAAIPAARNAVLEFLDLEGATVERRERLPALQPGRVDLGPATTLAAAERELGFAPLLPEALGDPRAVHVDDEALTFDYRPRALVTELRGDVHPAYVGKIGSQGTSIEELEVGGERAVWVSGSPHFFFYRDDRGRVREQSLRIATNVLLVERGELLVRVEGTPTKAEAIRIAESLR